MKERKLKLNKLNNKGSALVIVVVVIAFITILATLILYISVMNYQMKANDYRTKVSFYGAEIPLEEMRLQMAIDMSQACKNAYMEIMTKFDSLSTGEARKNAFVGEVFSQLQDVWDDRNQIPGGTTSWLNGFCDVLNDTTTDEYHIIAGDADTVSCGTDCGCAYHIILLNMSGDRLEFDALKNRAVLKNIKVVYTENGFTSIITTDFCFYVPDFDWGVDKASITWDANATTTRTRINYEKCVVYLNWTKQ